MRKCIEVECYHCGEKFNKSISEIKRTEQKGKHNFCSLSCSVSYKNLLYPSKGRKENLNSANRLDQFSPFRYLFRTAKMHCEEKGKPFNLTLHNMKDQWDKQNGICPYTGWNLILPDTSSCKSQGPKLPKRASLDRINSIETYSPENIQFVSMIANFAKNEWSEIQLEEFCVAVAKNRRHVS